MEIIESTNHLIVKIGGKHFVFDSYHRQTLDQIGEWVRALPTHQTRIECLLEHFEDGRFETATVTLCNTWGYVPETWAITTEGIVFPAKGRQIVLNETEMLVRQLDTNSLVPQVLARIPYDWSIDVLLLLILETDDEWETIEME